jgi:hypothetical protein
MGAVVSDTPVPEISGSDAVDYYGGHLIAESVTPSNARRIVACVNACAGMEDPAAEIARLQAENDELDEQCTKRILEIYKLRAERDELESALSTCIGWIATFSTGPNINSVLQEARAALAKVKGE